MKYIDKKNWRTKLIVTNKGWLMHIWKLMTWHGGDTAACAMWERWNDMAQLNFRCQMVIVIKSTCAKFVVVFEN